jgi:hypothetical protein
VTFGDPFPGARVEAVALRYTHGRRVPLQAGIATTSDLGELRVSGLEPGTYYVRASTIETWADDDEQKGTHAHSLTYFPSASGTDTAHAINVATGQEVSHLDIQLSVGRAVRIDGVVQNSSAEPMLAQAVHLERITRGARPLANEGPNGSGEARLAGPRLRPTPPVPAESLAMPADSRRRLHEHEGAPPGRPAPTQSHPEEPIDGAEPRAAIGSGQPFQLMPKCEILKDEILVCAERGPQGGDEGEAESEQAGQCERNPTRRSKTSGRSQYRRGTPVVFLATTGGGRSSFQ